MVSFFQASKEQKPGEVENLGRGSGWMKRLCLPSGMNSAADTVHHALAPGWFECPSSSGCQRQKLSPSAYGSVCATTDFFFFLQSTDILLKGKNPWKGQWISRLWGRQTMNHKCTLGLLCVCVCLISARTKMLRISLWDLVYFLLVLGKVKNAIDFALQLWFKWKNVSAPASHIAYASLTVFHCP